MLSAIVIHLSFALATVKFMVEKIRTGTDYPDHGPYREYLDQKIRTTDRTKDTRTEKSGPRNLSGPVRTFGPVRATMIKLF